MFMTIWAPLAVILICIGIAPARAAEKTLKPWNGDPTPALRLNDLDGKTHDLAAYRGKAVLINFWATWCEPCREELPSMNRLKRALNGKPFEVLAVDVGEEAAQIREFLVKVPVEFPVLLDGNSDAVGDWKIRGLPTTFILDPEGRIRYYYIGQLDWASPTVIRAIDGLLAKP